MKKRNKECNIVRCDERQDDFNVYKYELTMRRGNETASFRLPLYSVKVSMTDIYGGTREKTLCDVFSDTEKALRFYERLVENLATPIDLAYVWEDDAVV